MLIKIIRRPIGEAPEWVRDAWIGLELETTQKVERLVRGFGVLTGPTNIVLDLWEQLRGRYLRISGFGVSAPHAIKVLAESRPEAAEWWRINAPRFQGHRQRFVFDAEACSVLENS